MSHNTLTLPKLQYTVKISYSKDARLPVQLQRAMAAEAEAAREARAKVIWNENMSWKKLGFLDFNE